MEDRKGKAEVETLVASDATTHGSDVRPVASGAREDLAPDSIARTIALTGAVLSPGDLAVFRGTERYVPVRELGRGGMGRVDVMFDRALGRSIAMKTVLQGRSSGLLAAEAQICAQLEHPAIVPLYDVGLDESGRVHYTMRVIQGRTLREVLFDNEHAGRPHVGLTQLLGILRHVCLAVDYAHSRGVIHRDLKPENIILGGFGEVYVLDWGVAYVLEGSDVHRGATAPAALSVAGSPGYMAPEQAMGGAIDARTDVFALGVILHEMLTGIRPFEDPDIPSLIERTSKRSFPPPSMVAPDRSPPRAFDSLVRSCLLRDPADRPPSARFVADALDAFLDGERERTEREREAAREAEEGDGARESFEQLERRAAEVEVEAERMLATLKPWDEPDVKREAWEKTELANRMRAEAARALARAEASYARAVGRIQQHPRARAGLAAIYFRQFLQAEEHGQAERMAQYLDLAHTYDDGALALELADEGELVVEATEPGVPIILHRYDAVGPLLRLGPGRPLGVAPTELTPLETGSYLIVAQCPAGTIRYPLSVKRAYRHTIRLRVPPHGEVPEGFVVVPGGPYLGFPPRGQRRERLELRDYAIARFPITFREYSTFLEELDEETRQRRLPVSNLADGPPIVRTADGDWRLTDGGADGEGRKRVPRARELDLPAFSVSWYDALAFAGWYSKKHGRRFRLPTDPEWEKAMRGADGRSYPMGSELDPSFAKLRESRPEATQPEPVGAFELDESPYGVRDMAGGTSDWTTTFVDGGPPGNLEDEGNVDSDERQAYCRGGHWGTTTISAAMRFPQRLTGQSPSVGFRLALSLDQHTSSDLLVEPMKR